MKNKTQTPKLKGAAISLQLITNLCREPEDTVKLRGTGQKLTNSPIQLEKDQNTTRMPQHPSSEASKNYL